MTPSIDITTGMSAPPIGIIKRTPIKKEIAINIQKIEPVEKYTNKILRQKLLILKVNLNNADQKSYGCA